MRRFRRSPNPVYFEDPQVDGEVRPIFAWHEIDKDLGLGGGCGAVVRPSGALGGDRPAGDHRRQGRLPEHRYADTTSGGWADLAAGLKYAIIDDKAHEFILTPGVTVGLPTGNDRVFQATGDGTINPFVSVGKGFGKLRLLGNVGGIIPVDGDAETYQIRYSAQIDYTTCRYFVPFVAWNAFTVLSQGEGFTTDFEGFDLFNFGAQKADGYTQSVVGAGFRSLLTDRLQFGFAYELPVSSPEGIFESRFTVDFIWRF